MPADTTLAQEPGALHGNASAPYPCHAWPRPPSDPALIDKLRECIKAKPLQPLEWLAAALPPEKAMDARRRRRRGTRRGKASAPWESSTASSGRRMAG